jgi:hypothetical protein
VAFTRRLLAERGLDPASFILVQKPYMERRSYATFMKRWPEKRAIVTSPQAGNTEYLAGYSNDALTADDVVGIMVGDLQRIRDYPARGFQIPQEIPADVWAAYEELVALGYTDIWSAEAGGHEGLVPLALAAAWTPTLRLGTAILPVYTRGAATLAEATASMCQAAPGRFALGIGCSSPTIVENWNAIPFEKPYQRVRDTIRFLRAALSGEKVTADYETFSVKGFRLDVPVPETPPILVGALRGGMLRLAGREGDGAITNWLSPPTFRRSSSRSGPTRRS